MKIVDAEYIRSRLTGERGEKSALAEAIGQKPDVITKILNGTRRVQPHEMPLIAKFFGEDQPEPDPLDTQLYSRIAKLTDEEKRYVLGSLDGLIAQHQEEE